MKIVLLGLGFMGSVHARALGGRLAAVCSNDPRQLAGDLSAVQGNLGDPVGHLDFSGVKKYSEIAPALADPEIEAVDLCLPTHMHETVAIKALRAGKHVLVEKPIALDGAGAHRMIAEAEAQGRVLMTAQVLRFMPEYIALRDALKPLGPVRRACFHRRCAEPAWGGWLKDPALSGGGPFDLLIHDVDMCLHLFGNPEAVSATGYTAAENGIDVITAELHYPDQGAVVVTGGWHHPKAYPFSMEYTVVADKGTMEFNSADRPPTLYRVDGTSQTLHLPGKDGYEAEIEYFIACCREGREPVLCPPEESAAAVKLTRLMVEARTENGGKIPCKL